MDRFDLFTKIKGWLCMLFDVKTYKQVFLWKIYLKISNCTYPKLYESLLYAL